MSRTLPWLALIIGIFFCTYAWNYISVPYDLSNTIVGQYSLNKINPLNDTFRGIFFIFFPLFLYFITFLKLNIHLPVYKDSQHKIPVTNKNIISLSFILILFSISCLKCFISP